jgi:hypothetical protein
MYQRRASMKPASMSSFDNPVIRISALIKFAKDAQHALESKGEVDSALCFECLKDYLEQDYKPNTPFVFKHHAIGL